VQQTWLSTFDGLVWAELGAACSLTHKGSEQRVRASPEMRAMAYLAEVRVFGWGQRRWWLTYAGYC